MHTLFSKRAVAGPYQKQVKKNKSWCLIPKKYVYLRCKHLMHGMAENIYQHRNGASRYG